MDLGKLLIVHCTVLYLSDLGDRAEITALSSFALKYCFRSGRSGRLNFIARTESVLLKQKGYKQM